MVSFATGLFRNCVVDGELVDAIGIFKSENKETFLKVFFKSAGLSGPRQSALSGWLRGRGHSAASPENPCRLHRPHRGGRRYQRLRAPATPGCAALLHASAFMVLVRSGRLITAW